MYRIAWTLGVCSMALKFFTIPVREPGAADQLNQFLRSHRVLTINRRWVEAGDNSFWALCVDYLESSPPAGGGAPSLSANSKGRIDYREQLSPEDFAVFAKLRDLCKEFAQGEGVPPYAIFTNEQLAQIVQKRCTTKSDLEQIAGVGDARLEKYGARVLEFLALYRSAAHAPDGQPA